MRKVQRMSKPTKLVIFDYDGVLVNSFTICCMANELIGREFGKKSLLDDEAAYRDLFETDWKEALAKWDIVDLKDIHRAEEIFDSIVTRYRWTIVPYPGVVDFLDYLKAEGYSVAIASNNNKKNIVERLESLGLLHHFSLVLDHTDGVKPDAKQIYTCLEHFGVGADETVMIGDMDGDVAAAKTAGLKKAIAVTYGFHPKHKLHLADVIIDSPHLLKDVIE